MVKRKIHWSAEIASPVAQQDRHHVRVAGNRQVLQTVAIEVTHRHMVRWNACREICRRAEIASAVAQKDGYASNNIGGDEVLVSVTVEIAGRYPNRRCRGKESGVAETPPSTQ